MYNKTALVFGAKGFIGSHLTQALTTQGATVIALDRDSLDVAHEEQVENVFANQNVDFIFHLAGQKSIPLSKENPRETLETSFTGTLNILESARKQTEAGKPLTKIILFSSINASEPDSIYAASKISAASIGLAYHADYSLPVTVVKLANVYGPLQSNQAVIPSLISQMKSKNDITLGNLDSVRDFIYIDDVIAALLTICAHEKTSGQTYEIGTGLGTSIRKITEILASVLNFNGRITVDQSKVRANEQPSIVAQTSSIEKTTGWSAKTTIENGLKNVCKS